MTENRPMTDFERTLYIRQLEEFKSWAEAQLEADGVAIAEQAKRIEDLEQTARKHEKTKANKLAVAEERVEQLEAALGSLIATTKELNTQIDIDGKWDAITAAEIVLARSTTSPVQPEAPTIEILQQAKNSAEAIPEHLQNRELWRRLGQPETPAEDD